MLTLFGGIAIQSTSIKEGQIRFFISGIHTEMAIVGVLFRGTV